MSQGLRSRIKQSESSALNMNHLTDHWPPTYLPTASVLEPCLGTNA